jgi:ribosomal protein S18 acetylase RimI-like enzyme
MQSITIRDALPGDGRDIVALLLQSWHATYVPLGVSETDIIELYGDTEKKSADCNAYLATRDVTRSVALVALRGRQLCGVCFARVVDGVWQLTQLYVHHAYLGQGIGSQLIKACLNHIGDGECTLSVVAHNQRAIDFYQSHGFVLTGEQTEFVVTARTSLPELVMRLAAGGE